MQAHLIKKMELAKIRKKLVKSQVFCEYFVICFQKKKLQLYYEKETFNYFLVQFFYIEMGAFKIHFINNK